MSPRLAWEIERVALRIECLQRPTATSLFEAVCHSAADVITFEDTLDFRSRLLQANSISSLAVFGRAADSFDWEAK